MVKLEEDGVEFYDDTNGVPSYGVAPPGEGGRSGGRYGRGGERRRPQYGFGDSHRGGENPPDEIITPRSRGDRSRENGADSFGRRDYDVHRHVQEAFPGFGGGGMMPFESSGFGSLFGEMERQMRSAFGGMDDGYARGGGQNDLFGQFFNAPPFSGEGGPGGLFDMPTNGDGSSYSYSYSSSSYSGPDGRVYEEKRVRTGDGEEQVTVRRRLGDIESETVQKLGRDGQARSEEHFSSIEKDRFDSMWNGRGDLGADHQITNGASMGQFQEGGNSDQSKSWWRRFRR